MSNLKEKLKQYPGLKRWLHSLIVHPVKTRPRWWIRLFLFAYIKKGKGAVIYRSVRKDLPPFNRFEIGSYSVVEDFSCLNNAVGDIYIGHHCRIGLSNTIIGPVHIGDYVNLSQNVTVIGLHHNYQDVTRPMIEQGVTTAPITIGHDTIIGANSVILPGVTIGEHCFVGACSLVAKDIPPFSVCAGNPARIIRQYNPEKKEWTRITQ